MKIEEKIDVLKNNIIFSNLSEKDLRQIAELSRELSFKKGETIIKENEIADAFYIIVKGKVEIVKEGEESQEEVLATKSEGEVFGEMAVIDELPRSATIRATTNIELLRLDKDSFKKLLRSFSDMSLEIARSICSTVRTTNSAYIKDLEKRNKQLEAAYAKLKKTQNELIQVEKLSVIGKFASLIIHDIKNPMGNIRAYAELIRMYSGNNEKIQKSSDVIMSEVDRLIKMTSELLEFSRGEIVLNKMPINISSLLSTLVDTVKEELLRKNVKIIFNEKCDSLVMIDSEKISRVFHNLVSNSADSILKEVLIIIKTVAENNWVKWTIQDNGVGMNIVELSKIFEAFYTNKKKGTGLGMPIVKGIIESHNGLIKVFSRKDAGTRFEILLPKA